MPTTANSDLPAPAADACPCSRKIAWLLLALIIAIGAVLRFYRLDYFTMWGDPGTTFVVSGAYTFKGVLKLITLFSHDNPPLDLFARHASMALMGRTSYWFVFPSPVFSIVGLLATFFLARELLGVRIALIATALLSLHHLDIAYAHEGKNYSILGILSPLTTLALLISMRKRTWPAWAGYAILLAGCFFAHMITCGLAVCHAIFVAAYVAIQWPQKERRRDLLWLCAQYAVASLGGVLLFVPWIIRYLKTTPHPLSQYANRANGVRMLQSIPTIVGQFGFGQTLNWIGIIILAFALVGVIAIIRRRDWRLLVLPIFPLAGFGVSYMLTRRSFFHIRYILYALPMYMMLAAAGIEYLAQLARQFAGRIAHCAIVAASIGAAAAGSYPGIVAIYTVGWEYHGDLRSVAHHIDDHFQDGDVIVNYFWYNKVMCAYTDKPQIGVEATYRFRIAEEDAVEQNKWAPLHWRIVEFSTKPGGDNSAFGKYLFDKGYRRIWFVQGRGADPRVMPLAEREIQRIADKVDDYPFRNAKLTLYRVHESAATASSQPATTNSQPATTSSHTPAGGP